MAEAIPYLNENSLINYPLAQDQDVPEEIQRLLVDAGITFCMPFYCTPTLKRVEVSTQNRQLTIVLGSLESTDTFATITSSDLRFYSAGSHWYTARVSGDCGETPQESEDEGESSDNQYYLSPTICAVVDNDQISDLSVNGYSWDGNLLFDPHTLSYEPLRFEKLVLVNTNKNGTKSSTEIYPTSYRQIWFKGGHNVSITPNSEGIVISADPGAGEGKTPCECDDDTNGLSGNIQVVGDGCISVEQSPVDSSTIVLHDSCTACCQCSQYAEKVDALRGFANELSDLGVSIKKKIAKLNKSITQYNSIQQGDCEEKEWDVVLTASGNNPSDTGKGYPRVYASVSILNKTCWDGRVTMREPEGFFIISNGEPEPNTTQWYIGSGGTSGYDRTGIGLPYYVLVHPGETLKVMRTFIMNDRFVVPYPFNPDFSEIVKAAGNIYPETNQLPPVIHFLKELRINN